MKASALNKKLSLVIISILAATIILVAAGGFASWKKGQALKATLAEEKDKKNQLDYLQKIAERYQTEKDEEEAVTAALPTSTEVSAFLKELADFAQKTSVTIEKINFPTDIRKKEKISNFQTKLDLSAANVGPIENIIKKIESNRRIIDITEMEINDNGNETKATITLKTYYKNNEQK